MMGQLARGRISAVCHLLTTLGILGVQTEREIIRLNLSVYEGGAEV